MIARSAGLEHLLMPSQLDTLASLTPHRVLPRAQAELINLEIWSFRCDGQEAPKILSQQDSLLREMADDCTISTQILNKEVVRRTKARPIAPPSQPISFHKLLPCPVGDKLLGRYLHLHAYLDSALKDLGYLDRWRIRYQFEYRRHCYCNSAGSDIEQSQLWDVLGVVVSFNSSPNSGYLIALEGIRNLADREISTYLIDQIGALAELVRAPSLTAEQYPIIMGPQLASVFWHECLGHLMEADFSSSERDSHLGHLITSEEVNVLDDPSVPGANGSYHFDDEGTPAHATPLIERGRLIQLLVDRSMSPRLHRPSTGNGRFSTGIIRPRMSNLVVAPGETTCEQWQRDTEVLYLDWPLRGRFDGHQFLVECVGGYLRSPSHWRPVGRTLLTGTPLEALKALKGVGSEALWQISGGLCNKGGSKGILVGTRSPALFFERLFCTVPSNSTS
jgi:predicted Zn-dependent protease